MFSITALGVGGAFTNKYYHNNYVLNLGDRKFLIDAGTTLRYSLKAHNYSVTDITDILITHLHADHVGGLEEFAQKCKFVYDHKPNLWIRTDQFTEFEKHLASRSQTDGLTLLSYFNVCLFPVGDAIKTADFKIQTIRTDNLHAKGMKSFGFKVKDKNGKSLVFTSDIKNIKKAKFDRYVDEGTLAIYHDCSMNVNSPIHCSAKEILSYYNKNVLNKLFIMHYPDNTAEMIANYDGLVGIAQNSTKFIG